MSDSPYYTLADALGLRLTVDWESFSFEATGEINADFGFFKQKMTVVALSYIMDEPARTIAFILSSLPGDLGFYVEFNEKTKIIVLCPIDLSKVPKRGHALFEDKTVLDTQTGRWELHSALQTTKLDAYELTDKGHWRAACLDLSSGLTTSTQLQSA